MRRRKKKGYDWEPVSKNFVKCDQVGCKSRGEYQAPKTPNSSERYNFCLKHIKIYNKRWNFFAGKSQSEIYEFLRNELYNSETKPLKERISSKIKFDYDFDFDQNDFYKHSSKNNTNSYDTETQNALKTFKMNTPIESVALKKKYNALVKENHPDLHGQNPKKEKLLKKINNHYKILKKIAR